MGVRAGRAGGGASKQATAAAATAAAAAVGMVAAAAAAATAAATCAVFIEKRTDGARLVCTRRTLSARCSVLYFSLVNVAARPLTPPPPPSPPPPRLDVLLACCRRRRLSPVAVDTRRPSCSFQSSHRRLLLCIKHESFKFASKQICSSLRQNFARFAHATLITFCSWQNAAITA